MKKTIWTYEVKELLGMAAFMSVYMIAGIMVTILAFIGQHPDPDTFVDRFGMFMCGVYDTTVFPLTIGFWVAFFMEISKTKKELKENKQ